MDNNQKYSVRRFTEHDIIDIRRLWKIHFGEDNVNSREMIFKWILKGNPFSSTQDDYFVAIGPDGVIGYHGIMPYRISLRGLDVDATVHTDALIDPAFRGQRVLGSLLTEMAKHDKPVTMALWFNKYSSRVYRRFGWKHVKNIKLYVRIYDASSYVRRRLGKAYEFLSDILNSIFRVAYKIQKSMRTIEKKGMVLQEIFFFDERFDALFNEVKNLYYCIEYRTRDVLTWRYQEKPGASYRRFICLDGGVLVGFMIFQEQMRPDGERGAVINDFLCSPRRPDVFAALLSKTIEELEKKCPVCIEILSSHRAFTGVLKKFFFVPTGDNELALKVIGKRSGEYPYVTDDGRDWFFTFGDGDWCFWLE